MPRRASPWTVRRDPDVLRYAFFISHVREDAEEVARLKAEIVGYSGRGGRPPLACFLDLHDWSIGNENSSVIRLNLLESAHLVAWISPSYLATSRGWVWMELAYAELIEQSLNLGSIGLQHPYIVPVYRQLSVQLLERTPWLGY